VGIEVLNPCAAGLRAAGGAGSAGGPSSKSPIRRTRNTRSARSTSRRCRDCRGLLIRGRGRQLANALTRQVEKTTNVLLWQAKPRQGLDRLARLGRSDLLSFQGFDASLSRFCDDPSASGERRSRTVTSKESGDHFDAYLAQYYCAA
jgi:hypothetical protein